jgi:hypothetical protein
MFTAQEFGDWIEGAIILVVLVGSALAGVGKAIIEKLNRRTPSARLEDEEEPPRPRPTAWDRPIPPVARPMAPPAEVRRRVVIRTQPPTPQVGAPRKTDVEFEVAVPDAVRPIVEMLLGKTGPAEDRPRPRPAAPPPPPRLQRPQRSKPVVAAPRRSEPAITERAARLRDIEEREAQQARRVEKRIGHVETHVAAAHAEPEGADGGSPALDRRALRQAIVLNEILGPPVAFRSVLDR